MASADLRYEYTGSIHIHSKFSDGLRPIPEIVELAGQCGLDFLLFADHMTLEPLKRGYEKWYGDVLAIIGYEINDLQNINHYLVFGLTDILPPEFTAQQYVKAAHEKGAVGFIAHPDEKRPAMPEFPPYPWTAWDAMGYDGIEIWNHSSEWLEKLTPRNKYLHVLHPLKYLRGPEPETLERWDRLNREKSVAGIGGIDAHAYPHRIGFITIYIFRYKVLFRGIRTHVLTAEPLPKDADTAKRIVLDALKQARCHISNHRWGDARGFRFEARTGNTIFNTGDTVDISGSSGVELKAVAPLQGRITLFRDGVPLHTVKGKELSYSVTEEGAYRIEVRRKRKPWIYSNHIRVRGSNVKEL